MVIMVVSQGSAEMFLGENKDVWALHDGKSHYSLLHVVSLFLHISFNSLCQTMHMQLNPSLRISILAKSCIPCLQLFTSLERR